MPVKRMKLSVVDSSNTEGADTNGREFRDVNELWESEFSTEETRKQWYTKGVNYWMNIEASVDGVLGGFGHISDVDIKGSKQFLKLLNRVDFSGVAVECGAGIGRTSKDLLTPLFSEVDLMEPVPHFVEQAKTILKDNPKMKNYYQCGMEEWEPEAGRYSLIWIQWCLPHLPDADFINFFQKCIPALAPGGLICVKENNSTDGFIMDVEDTSITRTDEQYKDLFKKSGCKLIAEKLQSGFPKKLFPVRMYALIPDPTSKTVELDSVREDVSDVQKTSE